MNEEMKKAMAGKAMPELAIVDNNTLAALGLKGLLESVVPMVKISIFGTFGEFESNAPERFMHYFVSMQILLAHRNFFIEEAHRPHTIVLTPCNDLNSQMQGFHCICVNIPESKLIRQLIRLQRSGHPHGEYIPPMDSSESREKALSDREIEVLSLVAQGKINKEIAEKLFISTLTVKKHRNNILAKSDTKNTAQLIKNCIIQGII